MTRRKSPSHLGDLIPDVVDALGVSDRLDEARVESTWRQIAGPQIEKVTRRVRLHGDRLIVQLTSAAWRQALHMQRDDWRNRVNEAVGGDRVREVIFR